MVYRKVDEMTTVLQVEDGSERCLSIDEYVHSMESVGLLPMLPIRRSLQLQDELIRMFPEHRILYFLVPTVALFSPSSFLHEEHILTRIYPIQAKYIQFLKQYIHEFCLDGPSISTGSIASACSAASAGSGASAVNGGSTGGVSASARSEPVANREQQTAALLDALLSRLNELSEFGDSQTMQTYAMRFATLQAFTPLILEIAGDYRSRFKF